MHPLSKGKSLVEEIYDYLKSLPVGSEVSTYTVREALPHVSHGAVSGAFYRFSVIEEGVIELLRKEHRAYIYRVTGYFPSLQFVAHPNHRGNHHHNNVTNKPRSFRILLHQAKELGAQMAHKVKRNGLKARLEGFGNDLMSLAAEVELIAGMCEVDLSTVSDHDLYEELKRRQGKDPKFKDGYKSFLESQGRVTIHNGG